MVDIELAKKKYVQFKFLDSPMVFNELFKNVDYPLVQIIDINTYKINNEYNLIGFSGAFSWKNNVITPLDNDSYYPDMEVYGYCEFEHNSQKCLDLLVGKW